MDLPTWICRHRHEYVTRWCIYVALMAVFSFFVVSTVLQVIKQLSDRPALQWSHHHHHPWAQTVMSPLHHNACLLYNSSCICTQSHKTKHINGLLRVFYTNIYILKVEFIQIMTEIHMFYGECLWGISELWFIFVGGFSQVMSRWCDYPDEWY